MPLYYCQQCNQQHDGLPVFHADRPTNYWDVPEAKRETDVELTSDACVIADQFFFIRGCLEIPIHGQEDKFTFGVWVSLKKENFLIWFEHYDVPQRSHLGPFFGWLCTRLPLYPETMHLQTMVHLRDDGIRPRIVLEPADHPLYIAQHEGIDLQTALQMVHQLLE